MWGEQEGKVTFRVTSFWCVYSKNLVEIPLDIRPRTRKSHTRRNENWESKICRLALLLFTTTDLLLLPKDCHVNVTTVAYSSISYGKTGAYAYKYINEKTLMSRVNVLFCQSFYQGCVYTQLFKPLPLLPFIIVHHVQGAAIRIQAFNAMHHQIVKSPDNTLNYFFNEKTI